MLLKNKVAIITGGASGIGRGIAVKFAEEGGSVVVADITELEGKKTATEASQKGGDSIFVLCDVTSSRQVREMVNQVIRKYGRIDILVNNAGGVLSLTTNLAFELARFNINVNAILPWPIRTDFYTGILEKVPDKEAFFTDLGRKVPLQRMGTPEDIAGVALFLASELSSYVTGEASGDDKTSIISERRKT
jgi:NAD(P)-dependent dehydrogenase (short-subunit alcohol dehydrogenase family)